MKNSIADTVFGRKFPEDIDSPLFLDRVMKNFFDGLENADNSPSVERQEKIEHTISNLVQSFSMALEGLDLNIQASVSLIKSEIEKIGNNNQEG